MDSFRRSPELAPAYVKLDVWREANPDRDVVDDQIRLLNEEIEFVFDPGNAEYLGLLARFKSDTRALEKVLQIDLNQRELPIWVKGGKINACRSEYRRITFLLRPPFLTSKIQKGLENRMQGNDRGDNFILHFDGNNEFQTVRTWRPEDMENREAKKIFDFRFKMVYLLNLEANFLQNNYGNWPVFAAKIADSIEKVREAQKKINY